MNELLCYQRLNAIEFDWWDMMLCLVRSKLNNVVDIFLEMYSCGPKFSYTWKENAHHGSLHFQ